MHLMVQLIDFTDVTRKDLNGEDIETVDLAQDMQALTWTYPGTDEH